ncbi:MAG: ribonuclease, partial [Lewinella sp.]|nr:ribonuclease [Lewinella sp.]
IFITHLHGDHIYGLPGLLTSWALNQRDQPLTIFSPPGLEDMLTAIWQHSFVVLPFPIHFVEIDPAGAPTTVWRSDLLEVTALPLDHRVPAVGYLFREPPRPRTMRGDAIETFGIPFQQIPAIKAGADFATADGRLILNRELTTEPPPSRALAYCSDTRFVPALAPLLQGVDLLVHEATFLHEMAEHAQVSGHSTARQAAELAKLAGAGRLVLTHFSPRYGDLKPLLAEARAIFSATDLAAEGRIFDLPYGHRSSIVQ